MLKHILTSLLLHSIIRGMRSFSASKKQRERNKCAKRSSKTSEKVDKIENFNKEVQKGPY